MAEPLAFFLPTTSCPLAGQWGAPGSLTFAGVVQLPALAVP